MRPVLVALLLAAAAAGATFANVSLLGNAARSGDPIGKLMPSSYPVELAPTAFHRVARHTAPTTQQPPTHRIAQPPARTRQAPALAPSSGHDHRGAGRHADD